MESSLKRAYIFVSGIHKINMDQQQYAALCMMHKILQKRRTKKKKSFRKLCRFLPISCEMHWDVPANCFKISF